MASKDNSKDTLETEETSLEENGEGGVLNLSTLGSKASQIDVSETLEYVDYVQNRQCGRLMEQEEPCSFEQRKESMKKRPVVQMSLASHKEWAAVILLTILSAKMRLINARRRAAL